MTALSPGEKLLQRAAELAGVLTQDVERQQRRIKLPHDRRNYVRAVFAFVEGRCHVLRGFAVHSKTEKWTIGELAFLQDKTFRLTDNGVVQELIASPPLLAQVRFSLDLSRRGTRHLKQIDYSGGGWQALQRAVRIRNRLTHPRMSDDITCLTAS